MNAAEKRNQELRREERYMQRILRQRTAWKPTALWGIYLATCLGACGWLVILGILWLLVGCGAPGAEGDSAMTHTPPPLPQALQHDQLVLGVHVTVITRSSGAGNDLWTEAHIRQVLGEATRLVEGVVSFQLTYSRIEADESAYVLNQGQLLQRYGPHPTPRVLTVIISRPDTEDSAGRARTLYAHAPLVIMRARPGDTPDETAKILLHELGHCMALAHEPNPFYHDGLTTDNYWLEDAGRQLLNMYVHDITTN